MLDETYKRNALFCYKGFKAYQPLNVWWAEQQLVVRSEFRDGNVPAGYQQLRVLKRILLTGHQVCRLRETVGILNAGRIELYSEEVEKTIPRSHL